MFTHENVNPKEKVVGDCVIRAIARAEDKPWIEVFDTLTEIARKTYNVPSDTKVYSKYLKKYEKINVFNQTNGSKKRLKVKEICDLKGSYIVRVAGHLTAVVDGSIRDTWDCSNKSSYIIWKVK